MNKLSSKLLLTLFALILNSCFAIKNYSKNTKTTQNYSSNNIFLQPSSLAQKSVYINFRNSTIYQEFNLQNEIEEKLTQKGFLQTSNPKAPIIIQANLRYYGMFEKEILNSLIEDRVKKIALEEGEFKNEEFEKEKSEEKLDVFAIAFGSVVSFLTFKTLASALIGGFVFGGGAIILEHFYESKMVIGLLEIQISEKIPNSKINIYNYSQVNNGMGGVKKEEVNYQSDYKTYQTKIFIVTKNSSLTDKKALNDTKLQIISAILGLL